MASINEKLNYINETKSLIKDKLNDLGSEITNQTTFRNYADKIENLYEEWPKISDEDTAISLDNTKKGKINIQLKGNINQFTTTGKQLFKKENAYDDSLFNLTRHVSNVSYSNGILTITPTGTGNPRIVIYCNLSAGTYIFNSETSLGSATQLRNDNEDVLYNFQWKYQNQTFTINEDATKMWFNLENPQSTAPLTVDLNTLMISISGGSYEPYTGGIASPNPDYPQDIDVVTGENTIKIEGKNFLNKQDIVSGSIGNWNVEQIINGIRITHLRSYTSGRPTITFFVKPNTKYTYSQIHNDNNGGVSIQTDSSSIAYINTGSITVTTGPLGTITITFGTSLDVNTSMELINMQLEEGEISTNYEPYQSQDYIINLNSFELCKIENTQDYIYKNNNKWYKKPMILKINSYNGETISTSYKSTTGSLTTGATVYYINPNNNPDGIEITDTTLITQLNTLEQVVSYNGKTNISQENDNLPFIISASALLKNSN